MAVASVGFRCLVVAVTVMLICGQEASAQTCNANLQSLMSQCEKYVRKSGVKAPPSAACCAAVKPINVPCACAYVTKEIEALVSMEKVVFVARSCGIKVSPGTKCGSYTIPPA